MFKTTYQGSFFPIFHAVGKKPLENWTQQVKNGHMERITDDVIKSSVWNIEGIIPSTTFMTCPAGPAETLGIYLPVLVLLVKNLKQPFSFEIQVLDEAKLRRRFNLSSSWSSTQVSPLHCAMPLQLDGGWHKLVMDLSNLTKKAYGTAYMETLRVQINASCCVRSVYFCNRLYSEEETPAEFKLHLGLKHKTREQLQLQTAGLEEAGPSTT